MSADRSIPLPALIADIGGTNARFAVVDRDGALTQPLTFSVADFPDIEEALASRVLPTLSEQPHSAVFAIAGAVEGEEVKLTNGQWRFAPRALMHAFGFGQVTLFNDFEALALSLPGLAASDCTVIASGEAGPDAPMIVIGPGTGLGVAALVRAGSRWVPIATEGGHRGFGPEGLDEIELWRTLWQQNEGRISAEIALAGPGITRLYRAKATIAGQVVALDNAADITAAGIAGTDPIARETLETFVVGLGRFAGDNALQYLARGGVFLAGGVTLHLAELIATDLFRQAFVSRTPHEALLAEIPVKLITHPTPALLGVAAYVREPDQFLVDATGRCWR